MTEPWIVRYWKKVQKTETCWLWTGHTVRGYGQLNVDGRMVYVHRLAYEVAHGTIPTGLVIDHMCHVRECVNPAHLQVVTRQQNAENLKGGHADSKSGARGVAWDKGRQKWHVQVGHGNGVVNGGRFTELADAEAAAIALRNQLMTNNLMDRKQGEAA